MPNYLVSLPESNSVSNQTHGAKSMVIFAADAAGARRAAEGRLAGDGNVQWSDSGIASVVELVVGLNLEDAGDDLGWSLYARVTGGTSQLVDPAVAHVFGKTKDQAQGILGATRLHLSAIDPNTGGTGYSDDDILTIVGGTAVRAATCRVTGETAGVIDTVEMVDPGEYTVLPSSFTAVAVTDSGNSDAVVDLTQATVNSYEALVAQLVTDWAGFADFTPACDFSEGAAGARIITLGTIADAMGMATVELEFRHNGTVETVLASTIVDEGIDAAVLTVAIPAAPLAPPRVHVFQHTFL